MPSATGSPVADGITCLGEPSDLLLGRRALGQLGLLLRTVVHASSSTVTSGQGHQHGGCGRQGAAAQNGVHHSASVTPKCSSRGARCGSPATTAAKAYWLVLPSVR